MKDVRVLCIDHGSKRHGIAVSDTAQSIVTVHPVLKRGKWAVDKTTLDRLFHDYGIGQVLVGYPLNRDGTKGGRCQAVRDFVSLCENVWPAMPFFFWDETLSTDYVDNLLDNDMSMRREKREAVRDSMAAKVILDEALQWLRLREREL